MPGQENWKGLRNLLIIMTFPPYSICWKPSIIGLKALETNSSPPPPFLDHKGPSTTTALWLLVWQLETNQAAFTAVLLPLSLLVLLPTRCRFLSPKFLMCSSSSLVPSSGWSLHTYIEIAVSEGLCAFSMQYLIRRNIYALKAFEIFNLEI